MQKRRIERSYIELYRAIYTEDTPVLQLAVTTDCYYDTELVSEDWETEVGNPAAYLKAVIEENQDNEMGKTDLLLQLLPNYVRVVMTKFGRIIPNTETDFNLDED